MSDVENKETLVSDKDPDKDARNRSNTNWQDSVALDGPRRQVTERTTSEEEEEMAIANATDLKKQIFETTIKKEEAPRTCVLKTLFPSPH